MARVYHPTQDGKNLQNKKQGGPKEAKGGGKGKPTTPPAEAEKEDGEGE